MEQPVLMNSLLALIGLFASVASIANWDFFFESRKAQFIVKFMGRNGARIFYGLLGGAIFSLGFLALIGAINL